MRYLRQIILSNWGEEGQEKIRNTTVYVAGAGGLGAITAMNLFRIGFKHIHLIDSGIIEETNLNRQMLYTSEDIGKYKVDVAKERLLKINPEVEISIYKNQLKEIDPMNLATKPDIMISCLDNIDARFTLAKWNKEYEIPLVEMSISGYYGQLLTSIKDDSCIFCSGIDKDEKSPIPALSTTCSILSGLGVQEIIKYVLGIGKLQRNEILIYDGLNNELSSVGLLKSKNCPIHKENGE